MTGSDTTPFLNSYIQNFVKDLDAKVENIELYGSSNYNSTVIRYNADSTY